MKKSILLIVIIIFTSCNRELRRSISIYEQGLEVKTKVEKARKQIADYITKQR